MNSKPYELDKLTEQLIAEQQVCPYIDGCNVYHLCKHPDLNALYYTTHFCGDRFVHCKVYNTRQEAGGSDPKNPDLSEYASRASPVKAGL